MKVLLLNIFLCLAVTSCFYKDGVITITTHNSHFGNSNSNANVTSVSIINDQLVIKGSDLDGVTKVRITGPSNFDHTFSIESKTGSNLIANGVSNIAFALDSIFKLTLTNANGAATFNVTFIYLLTNLSSS